MWKKIKCKGKDVWGKCNAKNQLLIKNGLVEIRYSNSENAKIYRARTENVSDSDGVGQAVPTSIGFGSAKNRTAEQEERARNTAEEQINQLSENTVICFTDGSCKGNPGPAGVGVYVEFPAGESAKHHLYLGKATNNVAELTAISEALDVVAKHEDYKDNPIVIFTDSRYVEGSLTKNWKAKANRPLIQSIKAKIRTRGKVRIQWIAGHAGIAGNEEADQLANEAIDQNI